MVRLNANVIESAHEINTNEAMIIPEDELRRIARSLKKTHVDRLEDNVTEKYMKLHPSTPCDDVLSIRQLEPTLRAVIKTAGSLRLSESHAAAACDTLRGCLSRCEDSDDTTIRALAYSQELWIDILEVFLKTSENRKPKPLKLLLIALERNLVKNPSQAVRDALVSYVTSRTCHTIGLKYGTDDAVKPALQVLRHFMSKSIIRAQDIVLTISQNLEANDNKEINVPEYRSAPSQLDSLSTAQYIKYSHDFLCTVFHWVRYPDVAPSTGRLIACFSTSLRIWSSSWILDSDNALVKKQSSGPIWWSALKSSIERQPELLELFAVHVFPEMIIQDRGGIADLVEGLSLKNLTTGSGMGQNLAELHTSLLFLRAVKGRPSLGSIDGPTIEDIATGMLYHANPHIRSIAFSLVIQSSSLKEPFTETALANLLLAIPFYHAEVDPKARQDNVAMIKHLCLRLAGVLKHLDNPRPDTWSKDSQWDRDRLIPETADCPRRDRAGYEQHRAFFAWYFDFLLLELSPTASYQRHIISLKIIEFLMTNEISVMQSCNNGSFFEGKRGEAYKTWCETLPSALLDLALDPFDDVRELAASILHLIPGSSWSKLKPKGNSEYSPSVSWVTSERISLSGGSIGLTSLRNPGLELTLQRATKKMQSTARADHADGFGRLCELALSLRTVSGQEESCCKHDQLVVGHLVSELEECIKTARLNFHAATKTASLHGLLIAARYSILRYNRYSPSDGPDIEQSRIWRDLSDRLLDTASNVWIAVKDVLCADAPEGLELENPDNQPVAGSKEVLSFCWRALKESRSARTELSGAMYSAYKFLSTMMHSIIAGSKPTSIAQVLQHCHYRKFGNLAFTELAELRHRGAFSTVSQTFAECCVRCVQSKDAQTQALTREWYQKTLECIQQRASAITRRSAGLPAMITGILSAEPEGDFFDFVIQEVQAIASKEIEMHEDENLRLPQVHALNCLKDIFTDARFNASVEQHMSSALELAVQGLESARWAIRNCGLMLLKALITRINDGTNTLSSKAPSSRTRISSAVYVKYQSLPGLLLRLLAHQDAIEGGRFQRKADDADTFVLQAQRVFPALEMVEQSGIPEKHHQEIRQAVWSHVEGPVWPIRDKAARALSYLPSNEAIETEVRRCLLVPWSAQNALHGRLLYLRYLVSSSKSTLDSLHTVLEEVLKNTCSLIIQNRCPITRSSYTSLVADILEAISKHELYSDRPPNTKEHDRIIRRPSEIPSKFLSADWRIFAKYLHQECPPEPAFALEAAAKDRFIPLFESIENGTKSEQLQIAIGQTILVDMGKHGVFRNPEHADRMLRNTGYFLASSIQGGGESPTATRERIDAWSRALKLAQKEHAEIGTRQAAIDSLTAYLYTLNDMPSETETLFKRVDLLLILYDSLLDDDEDVRDTGAATVSTLLSSAASKDDTDAVRVPLMVPAARRRLLDLLKKRCSKSSNLWLEAVQRLVGIDASEEPYSSPDQSPQGPLFASPRVLLEKLKVDDTALFVEERQNLYIDEAHEAGVWREVLLSLESSAIEPGILRQLWIWATEGLDALTEVAESEVDGPLGWTSKPETFTLGVRILHAAEALMRLAEDKRLGVNRDALRMQLEKLRAV
ncbi:MAG: hypothetical protein Q9200_001557, partial [Gallowayella weberi]